MLVGGATIGPSYEASHIGPEALQADRLSKRYIKDVQGW